MDAIVPALFAGSEVQRALFHGLTGLLESIGTFEVEEKKTSLHIVAGSSAFVGVHPRKDSLRLNVVLSRSLEGDRVAKSERVSANRFHNEIDVKLLSDLDGELESWLKEAYLRASA